MKKKAEVEKLQPKQQLTFVAITAGIWSLVGALNGLDFFGLIISALGSALIACYILTLANLKCLKILSLLQGAAFLLCATCKILPRLESGFEWSQAPLAIEKMARSSFFMCFVILACILGFVAFLVIKAMPYATGIVAMVNTPDPGETKEDEVIEMVRSLSQDIDDYFRQLPPGTTYNEPLGDYQTETKASRNAVESAVAGDERLVQNASGPSAQQKLEESEKPVKLEKPKKPKKAKKTQKTQDAKMTKKQAKKIAKLEREIAERDRQIFCTKWYARASVICFAITCVVILLAIFSLIQFILVDLDAARNAWDSVRAIIIYQQLSLAVQLVLYVVCRAIGAPTNKWDLKALRKEQKRQKRDLKALQTR